MIVAPPLFEGADHETSTAFDEALVVTAVGTVGKVNGVATVVADALPGPATFTARIRTE